ncbi:DUF4153 domain-containing protein [Pelistega suis]|uniref:DUF4153 domain-containing protein n=1 Tax=Pelistega suis TaxID=1631957 RepID=A0A849P8N9_9BURK|nr:DUF4153 domain-containing protein [Pelistega suis]NOL51898.1 DUF4153 domain-containing protein [Pelistega suis]
MPFFANFRALFIRYPLECFFILTLSIPTLFLSLDTFEHYYHPWLVAPIAFVTLYRLHTLHRIAYYLSALILPVIMAWITIQQINLWNHIAFYASYLIALLVFLSKDWRKENQYYVQQFLNTLINLSWAGIAALILYTACMIIIFSADTLLLNAENSLEEINRRIALFSTFAVFPLFFLYFEDKGEATLSLNRFAETIIRFIFNPAILIYTAIIYIYIGRILITGEMPSNSVVHLVWPYLLTGLVIQALNCLTPNAYPKVLSLFRYLVLAPIALVWVALSIRLYHYGLTPTRIVLCATIGLTTLYYVLNLFQDKVQYRHFASLAIAMLVFLGFIYPPSKMAQQNQLARFEKSVKALNLVDDNNQPVTNFAETLQKIIHGSPEATQLVMAKHALDYLEYGDADKKSFTSLEQRFGEVRLGLLKDHYFVVTDKHADHVIKLEESSIEDYIDPYPSFSSNSLYLNYDLQNFKRLISLSNVEFRVATPSDNHENNASSDNTSNQMAENTIEFTFPNSDEKLQLSVNYSQHVADVFTKHGLDIQKAYPNKILNTLTKDMLEIDTPRYLLVLNNLSLQYSEEKGYELWSKPSELFLLEKK